MTRGKWIGLAAALLLALGALWYFASPAWTLRQMQAAAKAGDGDAIVAMVDFPALREDVKAELMTKLATQTKRRGDEGGGIGLVLGGIFIGPAVDAMVSPAAIRSALIARADPADPADPAEPKADRPRLPGMKIPEKPVIVRRGLSEFLLASETDRGSGLVFRREGLSWKLAGIELPPESPGPAS